MERRGPCFPRRIEPDWPENILACIHMCGEISGWECLVDQASRYLHVPNPSNRLGLRVSSVQAKKGAECASSRGCCSSEDGDVGPRLSLLYQMRTPGEHTYTH
jgi:hypothetical protein